MSNIKNNLKYYVYSFIDITDNTIVYIGCTANIYERRRRHFTTKTNDKLSDYLNKCKEDKRWPKLKILGEFENYNIAHSMEIKLIKYFAPKYNIQHNS